MSGNQKSQWYERCSTIGPASTMPRPPPMPMIAEISAIPCGTRSRGNSSRMIENASGKIAPPGALDDAAEDHHRQRRRHRRDGRPGGEREEDDHEHALLAEHVAEPAGDRRR